MATTFKELDQTKEDWTQHIERLGLANDVKDVEKKRSIRGVLKAQYIHVLFTWEDFTQSQGSHVKSFHMIEI